jgi:hypothetical protein
MENAFSISGSKCWLKKGEREGQTVRANGLLFNSLLTFFFFSPPSPGALNKAWHGPRTVRFPRCDKKGRQRSLLQDRKKQVSKSMRFRHRTLG